MSRSWHLVSDDLRPLVERMAAAPPTPSLEALRERMKALTPPLSAEDGFRRSERFTAEAPGRPPVRMLVYEPLGVAAPMPALLHMHGGGYMLGAPDASDMRSAALARDLGCVVVSIDYRLAPETRHPGPLEDCYAALEWLQDEAAALGVDPTRIGVMGESAGGGLAASLALLARDRGGPALAYQWLVYPMIDDRTGSVGEPHPYAGEYIWTAEGNAGGWRALLGETRPDGYAAAARAEDLAGLPPALIQVGALDLFIDENMDFARRLIRAGVATELHVYAGAIHGFFSMAPASGATAQALADAGRFVKACVA